MLFVVLVFVFNPNKNAKHFSSLNHDLPFVASLG